MVNEQVVNGQPEEALVALPVASSLVRKPVKAMSGGSVIGRAPSNLSGLRKSLVRDYHDGEERLVDRLRKEGKAGIESLVLGLVEEVVAETDHLLGSELVATHVGDIKESAAISVKRAQVLDLAIKAVQAKLEFEKERGIDVDSPAVMVVMKYVMSKVKETFETMNLHSSVSDTFFRMLGANLSNWQVELRAELEELNKIGKRNAHAKESSKQGGGEGHT